MENEKIRYLYLLNMWDANLSEKERTLITPFWCEYGLGSHWVSDLLYEYDVRPKRVYEADGCQVFEDILTHCRVNVIWGVIVLRFSLLDSRIIKFGILVLMQCFRMKKSLKVWDMCRIIIKMGVPEPV